MMIDDDNDGQIIFGYLGDLKLPDICLTGEQKPRKNLTQETCPDLGSNPYSLRDRRARYLLAGSGGRIIVKELASILNISVGSVETIVKYIFSIGKRIPSFKTMRGLKLHSFQDTFKSPQNKYINK